MFEVKKSREGDLVNNNLRYLLKKNQLTMSDLAKELNVTSQQISRYVLGDSGMGVENLTKICKILNCTPQQIYPMLDISGKTQLIQSTEEKSMKTTNTITIENYGFGYYIINFFKNITVVDFLTLNKKAILIFIIFMSIFQLVLFLVLWPNPNIFSSYSPDVRGQMLNTLGLGVDLTLTGLLLPLLVQTPFSYVSLWAGLPTLEWVIYLSIYGTAAEESALHYWSVSIVSLFITILYAVFVKYLRKKYLKDNGKD